MIAANDMAQSDDFVEYMDDGKLKDALVKGKMSFFHELGQLMVLVSYESKRKLTESELKKT